MLGDIGTISGVVVVVLAGVVNACGDGWICLEGGWHAIGVCLGGWREPGGSGGMGAHANVAGKCLESVVVFGRGDIWWNG